MSQRGRIWHETLISRTVEISTVATQPKIGRILHIDNNILTQAAEGRAGSRSESCGKGKLMSTYEEFMILLTFAGLIVSILNLKNK